MVIAIFGESCTGKSTLADNLASRLGCQVVTGKDYLRLAKNESMARSLFEEQLGAAMFQGHLIYVTTERGHLKLLPQGALRILVTAELAQIKERFAARMHGHLAAPVEAMLEKRHGCFDGEPHDIHVHSGEMDSESVYEMVKERIQ